jgi:hypothetical protein
MLLKKNLLGENRPYPNADWENFFGGWLGQSGGENQAA